MKKILTGIITLCMAASFTACDKCADKSCAKTAVDSVSSSYGTYVGTMINTELGRYENLTKAEKESFLRGLQLVFGAEKDENSLTGIQVASQMSKELEQMEKQGIKIDYAAVVNSFKEAFLADSVETTQINITSSVFRDLYQRAMDQVQAEKAAEAAKIAETAEGTDSTATESSDKDFVATFKAEHANAQTAESGLTYVIEAEGEGDKPAENANVVVHYTGKHTDGTVFDSSVERGEPATFNLQQVIPGFREGLMLLGKGGKATLVIPGNLAYGPSGTPDGSIKPNETLIFEIELIDIVK